MAASSSIEWTEATWNPVTGCTKVSPGCQNCYAERMSRRLQSMGHHHYARGFRVSVHEDALRIPLVWKRSRMIFVNSMSDLFHENVPASFISSVFDVMRRCSRHTFQILTKRSARLCNLHHLLPWPHNVWMGVSIENSDYMSRVEDLRKTPAQVKFVSFEPLLGPIRCLDLTGVNWVIVGGESGPGARPMRAAWVQSIHDECVAAGVPFFFKQWGGVNRRKSGRLLHGRTWDDLPTSAGAGRPEPDTALDRLSQGYLPLGQVARRDDPSS
jgi:protein gp37